MSSQDGKSEYKPYRDPRHPGNKIRPNLRCIGCRKLGCTTAWGPWCFDCNLKRLDHLNERFDQLEKELLGKEND